MQFGEYLLQISHGYDINTRKPKPEVGDQVKGMVVTTSRKINFAAISDLANLICKLSNSGVVISLPLAKDVLAVWDMYLFDPLLADAPAEIPEPEPETRRVQLCVGRRSVRRIINGIEQEV